MLAERVQQFIEAHELLAPGARVLVGLSGGADSVVLTYVLHRLGFDLVAAHVNYGLRREASEADEAFVRAFCKRLGVPLRVQREDPEAYAEAHGMSLQEAARALRYRFFARVAETEKDMRVAVAHHRDDQAETLLLNLFRGSGVEGLAGMASERPLKENPSVLLVRPLLDLRRAEIETYAREEGLSWRTDETNTSLKYRRGALREVVLPVVQEHFGESVIENIARAADLVRAYVDEALRPQLEEYFAACAEEEEAGGGLLRLAVLRRVPAFWRQRLILEALERWLPDAPQSAAVAEEIEALLDAQVGRRVELGAGSIWRERGYLRVVPEEKRPAASAPQPLALDGVVEFPQGMLRAEGLAEPPADLEADNPFVVYADRDRLSFPLTVRPWQAGDRFRPLGMTGTKKVSDFLTDEQVPTHRRKSILVVLSGTTIVWVAGHRLSEDVCVRPETDRFVRLSYQPADAR